MGVSMAGPASQRWSAGSIARGSPERRRHRAAGSRFDSHGSACMLSERDGDDEDLPPPAWRGSLTGETAEEGDPWDADDLQGAPARSAS